MPRFFLSRTTLLAHPILWGQIWLSAGCGTMGLTTYGPGAIDPVGSESPDEDSEMSPQGSDGGSEGGSSDDSSDSQSSGSPDTDDSQQDDTVEEDLECTYDRFPVAMHQATQDNSIPGEPMFIYQARNVDGVPFDELQILSYQAAPYNGPSSPGSYSLDGSNYADCALCVLLIGDCDDAYQCDQVFFVSEGTLDIQSLTDHGGPFRATLRDAVFQEVEIDPDTYETTPIPGGDVWCVGEVSIDLTTYLYD